MKISDYIKNLQEKNIHPDIIEEMTYLNNEPDMIKTGEAMPNFENMRHENAVPLYYFYIGMVFGIGVANKHDIKEL